MEDPGEPDTSTDLVPTVFTPFTTRCPCGCGRSRLPLSWSVSDFAS